jgi:hypothetical protein
MGAVVPRRIAPTRSSWSCWTSTQYGVGRSCRGGLHSPIHAFGLTGNFYRLQIETLRSNLSRAVQCLNLSFSSWYNRRHRRRGPLFRDALFFLWLSFTLWEASNAPRCLDRIHIRVCSLIGGCLRIDGMLVAPIQVLSLIAIIWAIVQLVLLGLWPSH